MLGLFCLSEPVVLSLFCWVSFAVFVWVTLLCGLRTSGDAAQYDICGRAVKRRYLANGWAHTAGRLLDGEAPGRATRRRQQNGRAPRPWGDTRQTHKRAHLANSSAALGFDGGCWAVGTRQTCIDGCCRESGAWLRVLCKLTKLWGKWCHARAKQRGEGHAVHGGSLSGD